VEKAECLPEDRDISSSPAPGSPRKVSTPGKRTIEEVSAFLAIAPGLLIKTLLFETDKGDVAVVLSGKHEVNETKVKNRLGADWVKLASEDRVWEITGAPSGYAGPVGLPVRILADYSVLAIVSGATGANEPDAHLVDVVPGRDFEPEGYADLRLVEEGDRCPRCPGSLVFSRGIEVGHVFRLGTKYSDSLTATYLDAGGKERLIVMGCYGIGVGRTAAAAIEQHHDADGIQWPLSIAPFEVCVLPVNMKNAALVEEAERVAGELAARGIEALFDDRDERPGIKFKDADLVGIPLRVTFGEKNYEAGFAEIRDRKTGKTDRVGISAVVDRVFAAVEEKRKECAP
jgi:prolyl-tRNA synthetase